MSEPLQALVVVFRPYSHFGIEAYLNGLLPQLEMQGINVTLLVFGDVEPQARSLLQEADVEVLARPVERETASPSRLARRRARQLVLREVLSGRRYDVIHMNTSGGGSHFIAIQEARRAGVPVIIPHGHSAVLDRGALDSVLMCIYRPHIVRRATHLVACSNAAGIDLYGERTWRKRGIVARNGIDTASFAFDQHTRNRMRPDGPDAFVVGFVGRLAPQKNPEKLLHVFAAVAQTCDAARLWIVGDGELRASLEQKAIELGIDNRTTFWGDRSDVPNLLQGMDCLVMPSRFEGLPVALVEAQASGLPCVISDVIDPEAAMPGCPTVSLPLSASDESCAAAVMNCRDARIPDGDAKVRAAGYDMHESAAAMAELYRHR